MVPQISAAHARTLLLDAQGLLEDPARRATLRAVERLIEKLGFVQVDSISRVERAHHLTIGARLDGYRPDLLDRLAFEKRAIFEHWTHDASLIPVALFPHWKPRFASFAERAQRMRWFRERMGDEPTRTIARVHRRIRREGPLRARDFERGADRPATGWWDWTPEKMALEFLWRTGRLAIAGRESFHKVYDLIERVLPEVHAQPSPSPRAHVEWACSSALERLGVATPTELSRFWAAIPVARAAAWCRAAVSAGRIAPVSVHGVDGARPRGAFALPDWEARLRRAKPVPERTRLLSPFDPLLRDRQRVERLFGFDYRFEAFTPAAKRRYGYYVLPILERDRFIGRLDPRHDRERSVLVVEKLYFEPGVRPTRARKRALDDALAGLAERIGARSVELPAR
ncbi:MAG: crosslink repair DNA glycosylase YcaQ family protein [Myxococcota bacterium]